MKVSVVIPTFNESESIPLLIPKILSIFQEFKIDGNIIVVDDASNDGTYQSLEKIQKEYDNFYIIERPGKLGIGSAYKDGFKYSASLNSDVVVQMDADLSHNPDSLPAFLDKINEGYDVIIGSRYIEHGGTENWSLSRKIISKSANTFAKTLLGLKIKDATSGYRAFTMTALNKIEIAKVKSDAFVFQVEVVFLCEKARLKVFEVPINFLERQYGESKLKTREIIAFLINTIKLAINYKIIKK